MPWGLRGKNYTRFKGIMEAFVSYATYTMIKIIVNVS